MTYPDGVSLAAEGRLEFVSQRGYFTLFPDGRHYTACMFACAASQQIWAGYRLPLARKKEQTPPENFVWLMQKTGDPTPKSGSTTAMTQKALQVLLPDSPSKFGMLTDGEILKSLDDLYMVRVGVHCPLLPAHLRRFVGSFQGWHALNLVMRRNGDETFLMDPFGRLSKGYHGEWVNFWDVVPAMRHRDGKVVVMMTQKDSAVAGPTPEEIIANQSAQIGDLTIKLGAALAQAKAEAESKARVIDGVVSFLGRVDPAVAGLVHLIDEEKLSA